MRLFTDDDVPAAPSGPLVRVRATVAYDGSGFRGFAANPGVPTVAGALVAALERVLGHPVVLSCAGRTDAGVHARGQVISFDVQPGVDLAALTRSTNALCGPAVVVRDLAVAPEGFDARFSALARRYRYSVLTRPEADPFLAGTAWHVGEALDRAGMDLACDPFVGEHDFAAFCRRAKVGAGDPVPSLVRRVRWLRWEDDPVEAGLLHLWIEADAFCQQMVRAIAGTLVAVGRGRCRAGDVAGILRGRDRAAAPPIAPPHGLCLWQVSYAGASPTGDGPGV